MKLLSSLSGVNYTYEDSNHDHEMMDNGLKNSCEGSHLHRICNLVLGLIVGFRATPSTQPCIFKDGMLERPRGTDPVGEGESEPNLKADSLKRRFDPLTSQGSQRSDGI